MAGEAGLAARAVGGDAVVAEDQVALPQPLEDPPAALDVVVGVGDVGVVHVHPEADAVGHALPLADVAEDRLPAPLVEGLDAVRLDLLLAREAELALDLQLDGQAVRVPAALPRHAVAAHGAVARDQVLEDPRQHVVDAGVAVRRGRPLVERKQPIGGPLLHAATEDVALPPQREHALLLLHEGDARGHRLERPLRRGVWRLLRSCCRGHPALSGARAGTRKPAPCGTGVLPAVPPALSPAPGDRSPRRGPSGVSRRPMALPLLTVGAPAEPTGPPAWREGVRSAARE